jgi:hypothetical protein
VNTEAAVLVCLFHFRVANPQEVEERRPWHTQDFESCLRIYRLSANTTLGLALLFRIMARLTENLLVEIYMV